jgi:DNA polymerase-3 subunit delta'
MPFKPDHALDLIARAHGLGRLGHAYLITGPREADLEEFALCVLRLVSNRPKHRLEDFQRDGLYVLRPEGKSRRIVVGDSGNPEPNTMRHFMHHFQMCSDSQLKAGLIADAERMNDAAQNAFLRTLEEPPPGTLFLLLTHNPKALLTTTRSRVIEIPLLPPGGARKFGTHEKKLLALLEKIAARSGGSIGAALGLKADFQAILEELHTGIEKDHESAFEKEQDHYKQTTDGSWLKQREEQVAANIQAEYLGERDALLDLLLAWMGDVARQQVGSEHLDLPEFREATAKFAERWSPEETSRRLRVLRQLESHLHTNVNEGLALEVAFIQAFGA